MIPRMKSQQWKAFVFWGTEVIKRVGRNMRSITQLYDMLLNYLAQPVLSPKSYYNDYIMSVVASQITSLAIVYSTVYSGADQTKHQSSASLAFVRGIHRSPGNSPHKGPVTRKIFPFDDVIMLEGPEWGPVMDRSFVLIFLLYARYVLTRELVSTHHWSNDAIFACSFITGFHKHIRHTVKVCQI